MRITQEGASILFSKFLGWTENSLEVCCSGINGNRRFLVTFWKYALWETVKRTHSVLSVCVQCDLWLTHSFCGTLNVFSMRCCCWHGWVCAGGMGVFKGRIWTSLCPFPFQISSRCAPSSRRSSEMGRTLAGGGEHFKPWRLSCPRHRTPIRRGPSAFAAFSALPHHSESACLRLYRSLLPSQQEIKSPI